jgi:hypothetical protein
MQGKPCLFASGLFWGLVHGRQSFPAEAQLGRGEQVARNVHLDAGIPGSETLGEILSQILR